MVFACEGKKVETQQSNDGPGSVSIPGSFSPQSSFFFSFSKVTIESTKAHQTMAHSNQHIDIFH